MDLFVKNINLFVNSQKTLSLQPYCRNDAEQRSSYNSYWGKYGAEALTPENYDITLIQSVLEYAIALLDLDKKKETPITTFRIESGSVNNIFTTSKQKAVEFASVLSLVASTASIDQLDAKTAVAFEGMQKFAIQNNFNIDVSTSESTEHVVRITPQTYYKRTENVWADAEVYYYGTIVDAGGKKKTNLHYSYNTYLASLF